MDFNNLLFQWFKANRANYYTIPITFNSVFIVIAQLHSSTIDNVTSSNGSHAYICSAASVIYSYNNTSVWLRKNMEQGQDHLLIIGI